MKTIILNEMIPAVFLSMVINPILIQGSDFKRSLPNEKDYY